MVRGGAQAQSTVWVRHVGSGHVEIIRDGKVLSEAPECESAGADHQPYWIRADVRDDEGRLLLVGKPIYINCGSRN